MRLFSPAPPVPTSAMFALAAIVSCSTRPCSWHSVIRPFSCCNRLRQEPGQTAEEEVAHQQASEREWLENLAGRRERYAKDPVYRQKSIDSAKKWSRRPEIRTQRNAYYRARYEREKYTEAKKLHWANDLGYRRATCLSRLLLQGALTRYTWSTHAPTQYTDHAEHYCTSCNRVRFLKRWWKEKPEASGHSEQPSPDRYMCNHCFANDWPRVVPETYEGTLSKMFRSPDFPQLKAQKQERIKEERQEDQESRK